MELVGAVHHAQSQCLAGSWAASTSQCLFLGIRANNDVLVPLFSLGKMPFQLKCQHSLWKTPNFRYLMHGLKISSFALEVLLWYLLGVVNYLCSLKLWLSVDGSPQLPSTCCSHRLSSMRERREVHGAWWMMAGRNPFTAEELWHSNGECGHKSPSK